MLNLTERPVLPVDQTLKELPSFALFRRNSSSVLQPTSQGVSLRGIGPSGASRSAVFLDGIPFTDAFGGWVAWTKQSSLELKAIEVSPGGSAGSWGNAALAGTIHLISRDVAPGEQVARASVGSNESLEGEFLAGFDAGGALSVSGGAGKRQSPVPTAPSKAGPVDQEAGVEFQRLALGWRRELLPDVVLSFRIRAYQDDRNNGTLGQYNAYRERQASVQLESRAQPDLTWSSSLYGQRQHFRSTFTAINASRTVETPSSDQYAVPAEAWGGSIQATRQLDRLRLSSGADIRSVTGETREAYSYNGTRYTRDRRAGGSQDFIGGFVQGAADVSDDVVFSGGARLDTWRERDGKRLDRSTDLATVYREEHYRSRRGVEFTPEVGFVWKPHPKSRTYASAQSGFRRPTLNELYRPFRVGNDLTEPNPKLRTERIRSFEVGAEQIAGPATFRASVFRHELTDVVASVTRYRGPGTYPEFGFIPAGGTGRVRDNLDRALTQGLELGAKAKLGSITTGSIAWQSANSTVKKATSAPDLVGRRMPQVPRNVVTSRLELQPLRTVLASVSARWSDTQFEDDDNRIRLPDAATVDASFEWRFTPRWKVFATVQNAFDTEVEASRSATGTYTLGYPREWHIGFAWN